MKTFFNLVQEVQKPGFCHHCGGCVSFCTAINYAALEMDADGKPRFRDMEKCIECGLCYAICPEIGELDEEIKRQAAWSAPVGRVIETTVVQSTDDAVRAQATDGGAVTTLLLHMLERGRIDGAIVTRQCGPFQREPFLATSAKEIKEAAGFFIDTSHGMESYGAYYLENASIQAFDPMVQRGLRRVAFVGTPCQISAIRRMQALSLVPADSIAFVVGLFCSGNFHFGDDEKAQMAELGGFDWNDVERINLKGAFIAKLKSGEIKQIDLADLEPMKRFACRYCPDYSAEFADIACGGVGAPEGWTTVVSRTPLGRAVLADARTAGRLAQFDRADNPEYASEAAQALRKHSAAKKKMARHNRHDLTDKGVQFNI